MAVYRCLGGGGATSGELAGASSKRPRRRKERSQSKKNCTSWRTITPSMPSTKPVVKATVHAAPIPMFFFTLLKVVFSIKSRVPSLRKPQALLSARPRRTPPNTLGRLLQPPTHRPAPHTAQELRRRRKRWLRLDTATHGMLTKRCRKHSRSAVEQGLRCKCEDKCRSNPTAFLRVEIEPRHCTHTSGTEASSLGANKR